MKKKRILGRGLKALLRRDIEDVKKEKKHHMNGGRGSKEMEPGGDGKRRALKTYKSILKKCVTEEGVGEMYEGILKELREHFGITEDEHQRLLKEAIGGIIPAKPPEKEKVIALERGEGGETEEKSAKPSRVKVRKMEDFIAEDEHVDESSSEKITLEFEDEGEEAKETISEGGEASEEVMVDMEEEDILEGVKVDLEEGGELEEVEFEEDLEALPGGVGEHTSPLDVVEELGEEILEEMERGFQEIETMENPPEVDVNEIRKEAETLLKDNRWMAALEKLEEAAEATGDAFLYNDIGFILFNHGELDAAEEAFRKAVEGSPGDPAPLVNLSMLQAERGRLDEALENMKKAHTMDPQNEDILNNLAYISGKMGRFQEALEYLAELLEMNPENVDGWFNQAVIYEKMGEVEKAYISYDRVLTLDPGNREAKKARDELFSRLK